MFSTCHVQPHFLLVMSDPISYNIDRSILTGRVRGDMRLYAPLWS